MKIDWNSPLSKEIQSNWINYKKQLSIINDIQIPRQIICFQPVYVEIHGYCDASETAYGACIYSRSIDSSGEFMLRLICAKSRVAPLKSISLPKLELQSTVQLSRIYKKFRNTITFETDADYFLSDSTIILSWIRGEPAHWKTYVSNRVSEIQNLTDKNAWNYVKSEDNPADVI